MLTIFIPASPVCVTLYTNLQMLSQTYPNSSGAWEDLLSCCLVAVVSRHCGCTTLSTAAPIPTDCAGVLASPLARFRTLCELMDGSTSCKMGSDSGCLVGC